MFHALHLPALPLEAILRHHPERRFQPHAVLSSPVDQRSSIVAHCNRPAARQGVHPGLSPTRALARCPGLRFLDRDPDAEATALRDLLQLAEFLTPDFELTTPDTLILGKMRIADRGSRIDRGKWSYWQFQSAIRDPHSTISALGLPLHLTHAATPDLAHLLSLLPSTSHVLVFRGAESRWKHPASTRDPLATLPLSLLQHLELGPGHLEILAQWGLRTLADLAKLPRQGLAERLGPAIATIHDLLHGKTRRLLRLFRPSESVVSTVDLEHPVDRCEPLVFLLKRSLHTLCSRLASSYRAASDIELQLDLESPPAHLHRIRLPEPSASPEILLRPLVTHLDHLQLPSPVTRLELTLTPCTPHAGQHELFDRGIRHPHRLADTLTRLAALLGDDRLGFPVPAATHRPDTFHLLSPHRLFENIEHRSVSPSASPDHSTFDVGRSMFSVPLSRFRPPIAIAVAFETARPHPIPLALLTGPHRGRITDRRGPFPLSGHWWDPAENWQHLEWDIRLETRHLLRLTHTPPDQWHLHGSYS